MNQNNGTIGVIALYLLFIWLISAAGGAWLTERKGYGERLGLLFGLVLSAAGLILALALPGRPGSKWKREGPFPRRRRVTGRSQGRRRAGLKADQQVKPAVGQRGCWDVNGRVGIGGTLTEAIEQAISP